MVGKSIETPRTENPGKDHDSGPVGDASSPSGLENPDAAGAGLEALGFEAEQQSVFAEAGVSSALLALRDAVEATLLAASGQTAALSEAPSTQGIVGVGIGLSDPDSIAFGAGGPGEPTLTLFTESALPQVACHMAYTNEHVHRIVTENLDRSPTALELLLRRCVEVRGKGCERLELPVLSEVETKATSN